MNDLIIIGGGPAGAAAGVYAARKQIKTVLVTEEFGGQSIVSPDIQNWIGTPHISGDELAKALKSHVEEYAGDWVDIREGERVKSVEKAGDGFEVKTGENTYQAKSVLVSSGARRRKLEVPGADKFEHKGVTYCASCDGPLFADMDTVVVGGGNAGFETAAQLLSYAKSVTLIHRSDEYKADPVTVKKVLANPKMRGITNSAPTEIVGDGMVTAVKYKDNETGEVHEISASGVFVEIGSIPNTDFVGDIVDLDEYKRIKIDPWSQETSEKGIWAAGDCSNVLYHQNNIATGDAVRALEDIYLWLNAR
ncbi:MAG: FAD-dependent oxidoreductase [Candidatus Paceibacterota bacterium]